MTKILIRAGMTPIEDLPLETIINRNYIGDNTGNLIYQYGVMRALMTADDVEFVPDRYQMTAADADWVNENCSAYVIPLADAFRPNNNDITRITKLVRKLRIPCVVIGVGLRSALASSADEEREFDGQVKEFVAAVLEKSSSVGVRGYNTGAYLEHLGFREGEHFTVTGCPSLYAYGGNLQLRDLDLHENSFVSVNMNVYAAAKTSAFLQRILSERENSVYIAQRINELKTLYLAEPYLDKLPKEPDSHPYPRHITDELYAHDRIRVFTRAIEWIDFLRQADLSVGARIHGNITALLAGTPAVVIPRDSRMAELAEYHAVPHVLEPKLDKSWTLEDLLERVDLKAPEKKHAENFAKYTAFLDANELDHIFKDANAPSEAPLDRAIATMQPSEPYAPAKDLTAEQLAVRWKTLLDDDAAWRLNAYREQKAQVKSLRKQLKNAKAEKQQAKRSWRNVFFK